MRIYEKHDQYFYKFLRTMSLKIRTQNFELGTLSNEQPLTQTE